MRRRPLLRAAAIGGSAYHREEREPGMNEADSIDLGPIDYLLIEWRGRQPQGEAAPHLIDLVERGIIRILDLSLFHKDENGEVSVLAMADVEAIAGFEELAGVSSGLLSGDDLEEAAAVLEPGTSAALLVYENSWAAPLANALRNNGGELIASGRIPIQAVVEALDAAEASS
jgi:Family of unknown function (DUF6325)